MNFILATGLLRFGAARSIAEPPGCGRVLSYSLIPEAKSDVLSYHLSERVNTAYAMHPSPLARSVVVRRLDHDDRPNSAIWRVPLQR